MLIAPKFTPEVLIEAPRRGVAIPNHNGTLALYTSSTHTIGKDTLREVRVMNIETGDSVQISDSSTVHDASWLGDESNSIIYLKSGEKGVTQVMIANADEPFEEPHVVGEISATVGGLKVKALDDGSIAIAVVGLVDSEGNLFNEETAETNPSSVRVYDTYKTRFWDTYLKPQKYTIWYSKLIKSDNRWTFSGPLQNLIPGSDLEAPSGMYDGLWGAGRFDICHRGIVFVAEDPNNKNPFFQGMSDVYYVPLESFSSASTQSPRKIPLSQGSSEATYMNPRFSPDGSMIAFLKIPLNRLQDIRLYIGHIDDYGALDVFRMVTGTEWDLIPEAFEFSPSGHSVFIQAQDCARVSLYELELQPHAKPKTILRSGSVSAFFPLRKGKDDKLLVTSTSLVESSLYQIVDVKGYDGPKVVSSASKNGARLGLSPDQVSEIYFEGAGDYCVQAWVVKPRDFDSNKKYPLALLIHGGPQIAWTDSWSTRWNPAVWAEQGYIVVSPNPTGSTGFGIEFTERINGSWGGLPYQDLVNCMEYLKDMPGIDLENAVAAGSSYGGYMINWINGNPLGRKFKCLVCHDGIFHLPVANMMSDMLGIQEDFKGPPYIWASNEEMEKWNPARPELLRNWKTPMMIIHSDKDYRCPVTEGLAAHNTLQSLGTPSRFVNFPDETHFVLKEENSLAWHRLVFEWINKWSGVSDKAANEDQ